MSHLEAPDGSNSVQSHGVYTSEYVRSAHQVAIVRFSKLGSIGFYSHAFRIRALPHMWMERLCSFLGLKSLIPLFGLWAGQRGQHNRGSDPSASQILPCSQSPSGQTKQRTPIGFIVPSISVQWRWRSAGQENGSPEGGPYRNSTHLRRLQYDTCCSCNSSILLTCA